MSSRDISINDTEIERGRGRSSDSSSSRESSPLNKRKRDMTPPSDGESVVPAIVEVDTPPPLERPIVREPVAFSSSVTMNVDTYQASLPTPSNFRRYLPGQDPSSAKAKRKRNKRTAPFSAQTTRFRVQAYEHNPGSQTDFPPLQRGPGPYNSLYRASDDSSTPVLESGSVAEPRNSQSPASPSRPSSKRARLSDPNVNINSIIHDPNLLSMPGPTLPQQDDLFDPSNFQSHNTPESRTASTGGHNQPQIAQSGCSSAQKPSNRPSEGSGRTKNSEKSKSGRAPAKRPGFNNRMITILIHDTRSGKVDRQLTEVTIPVKMADDPQDGFWADARDITEKLQSGPSRIDGPARVYTMRGKYRQFFLRVSAVNVDQFASANVGISADRTLDVVVEKPPEIGAIPSSPRIPSELLPSSPEVVDTSDLSDEIPKGGKKTHNTSKARNKKCGTEKRENSSPDDDSSDPGLDARNKHSRRKRALQKKSKETKGNGTVALSALDYLPPLRDRSDTTGIRSSLQTTFEQVRGYESPSTDEDPGSLYDMIVRSVEVVIQKQPDGPAYSQWRIGKLRDLIKACGFIQRMMDQLVGELAPFRTKTHEIRKSHVLAALRIEPKMASECTETLELLKLYGENGTRCHDPRVLDFIARDDPKAYKQLKLLLRLLRSVHEEWKRDHGASQSETMEDEPADK